MLWAPSNRKPSSGAGAEITGRQPVRANQQRPSLVSADLPVRGQTGQLLISGPFFLKPTLRAGRKGARKAEPGRGRGGEGKDVPGKVGEGCKLTETGRRGSAAQKPEERGAEGERGTRASKFRVPAAPARWAAHLTGAWSRSGRAPSAAGPAPRLVEPPSAPRGRPRPPARRAPRGAPSCPRRPCAEGTGARARARVPRRRHLASPLAATERRGAAGAAWGPLPGACSAPAGPSWHSRARSLRAPGRRPGNGGLAGRPRRRSLSGGRAEGGPVPPRRRGGGENCKAGRRLPAWRCCREAAPDSRARRRCRRSGCHGDRGTPGGGGGDTPRAAAAAAPPLLPLRAGRALPAGKRARADFRRGRGPTPGRPATPARFGTRAGICRFEDADCPAGVAVPPFGSDGERRRALSGRAQLVEVLDPIKAASGAR